MPLHKCGDVTVHLLKFDPGARVEEDPHPEGEELLVLEGGLRDERGHLAARDLAAPTGWLPAFDLER